MPKVWGISLASLLALCSITALLHSAFPSNQSLDRLLRRTWIYRDDEMVVRGREQLTLDRPEAVARALEHSQTALVRDAGSPYRWRDLGRALAQAGQTEKAIACYRRSVELGPNNPTTLTRAASFFGSINQPLEALPYYARTLQLVSNWDTNIFDAYGQMRINVMDIWNLGIGLHERPARAYFQYLIGHHYPQQNIQATWNWIDSHSLADDLLAANYIDFLLKNQLYEKAASSWARHLGNRKGTYLESNYVCNGEFENDFTGAIFDWRITPVQGAVVERDPSVAHSGKYSLKIDFDGKQNLAYNSLTQTAFVRPGKYRFEAYIRTKDISTDQGVGIRIWDAQSSPRMNVRLGNMTGTHDWTRVESTITVPKETHLLTIAVVRDPSAKFDNQIRGTAWMDSVTLAP